MGRNHEGREMKDRGFYRAKDGRVFEYVYYADTGEVTAFGPVDKFGGGEKEAFDPVAVDSPEGAQGVIREKLGEGTFEDDWV
jgi:hypothetical protein